MHNFKEFPELTNAQMDLYYWDSPHKQIQGDFNATVVRVIDGDTIEVKWDERDFNFPVRLDFIDAPEKDESGGTRSTNWLEREIEGEDVLIKINPHNRIGKFGRIIGEIIHLGRSINQLSLDFNYSVPFGEETA